MNAFFSNSDSYELVQDIHKDIKTNLTALSRTREKGKRIRIQADIKNYRKELRER